MAKIIIPTPLRKFTDNQSRFETSTTTVGAAVNDLVDTYPNLRSHLLDESGNIRSFIKIFVGEDDIKSLNQGETAVAEGTTISIIPAIAGGSF